ncbi:MAG: alpha/beta hydrolase [bacterium]|nr:alpha/beta hydrolase [Gammaproteobacteria bacterium]HIL94640.1 alpha/beta hydrolase [Pseudomonadales bacterium]
MQHPAWFTDFVSKKRLDHFIDIDQGRIHYQSWGESNKPGLLFVHGHAAHSHWWDFIAPAFLHQYHVAAMDMSGYGDSDHRNQYSAAGFANEILGVAKQLGEHTTVVGHSFGGAMTRVTAYLHGDELAAIVLVDSVISAVKGTRKTPVLPKQKSHFYPSVEAGMRRFRLRPPQSCDNRYLLDYIARHSLKETDHGFEFKLDQSVFSRMIEDPAVDLPDAATMIRTIGCPVAFVYGGQSRFFPPQNRGLIESLFNSDRLLRIEDAHHHIFLDEPLEFIRVLTQLLQN